MAQQVAQYTQQKGDQIARQFYDRFKKVHTVFVEFIQGMDVKTDREWYATLMLSRLMFCYFIQKSNFLDNNKNYLRDRLESAGAKKKANRQYSFYKHFLIPLFQNALGAPHNKGKLHNDFGNIPYLDGGLFEAHTLEKKYPGIEIDDQAFIILFDLFDQYTWQLDTHHTGPAKDINPDIVGYIFEKYINDRAQMGAYYTREDITDYISKNCIIPWLFRETEQQHSKAFMPGTAIWKMFRESGSRYIYHSLKKGVSKELPGEIALGISAINNRNLWDRPAPAEFALPDETWREVIDRRNRYADLQSKIETGSIQCIEDFITYNLNIRQFARDVISCSTDPELLQAFYGALQRITILDPTCGSGAFLLAAMNILEELYEDCLERMKYFAQAAPTSKQTFFRQTLADVFSPRHPNLQYFIYKNIILRNLHGVDIMPDAVEITRLRLQLKMMAAVNAGPQQHATPELLPDTAFNIRAGNALIGLASQKELHQLPAADRIQKNCIAWAEELERYKAMQLSPAPGYEKLKAAKEALTIRQKAFQEELNRLYFKQSVNTTYKQWLINFQPFHWYADYFPVIGKNGGFDVIIGNPPYVEYAKVKHRYTIAGYETESCRNLYPYVVERSKQLLHAYGATGFILPLSAFCTQRMQPLVRLYRQHKGNTWVSHFGWRPATLFEGVNIPLSVAISTTDRGEGGNLYVTEYYKWYREKREHIMNLVEYNEGAKLLLHNFVFPKIGQTYNSIFEKLLAVQSNAGRYVKESPYTMYYRNTGGLYWRIIIDFKPAFLLNGEANVSSTLASISFETAGQVKIFTALFNSNLFWLYYVAYGSFHHLNPVDLASFPVSLEHMNAATREDLAMLSEELMADMKKHSVIQTRIHKGGSHCKTQTFYPSRSWQITNKIDTVLARYYGFTDKELDNILHYDIKFRLQIA